jgi:amidase
MNKTSDYTTAIVPMGFKGLRIGVPRSYFYNSNATSLEDEVYTTTNAVLAKIAALGATIQDPADLPSAPDFMNGNVGGNESFILNADFKVDLATYFAGLTNSTVMSLADVINFNDKNAAVEMPVGQCCQGPSPVPSFPPSN